MELTIEQTELLYEATEIFHMWYSKYYPEPPSFSELLQINHIKIVDLFDDGFEYTDSDVTTAICELKETYFKLLSDY